MGKNMYLVSSASDKVKEYFDNRDSAIAFIVDEFAMALTFRDDKEGDRLMEYMKKHDETPNQYPFKYFIEEVKVNHDYDKPNIIYVVECEDVVDCQRDSRIFIFDNHCMAQSKFDQCVDDDIKRFGGDKHQSSRLNPSYYTRWNEQNGYNTNHYDVRLRTYTDNNKGEFE